LAFEVMPVIFFNRPNSGTMIATASFRRIAGAREPRLDITISADLDARQYREESAIRRRAGRAAVAVGVRAAKSISNGTMPPLLVMATRQPRRARASWICEEWFEGFSRRLSVLAEFRADNQHEGSLRAPQELLDRVARSIRVITDGLHVAIDDPEYHQIFGGR
jgi:hypothetical protein